MAELNNAAILWKQACEILVDQVSEVVWSNTFREIHPLYLDENCLTLEVPSQFIRDRIEHRHRDLVMSVLSEVNDHPLSIEIRVNERPIGMIDDFDQALTDLTNESVGRPTSAQHDSPPPTVVLDSSDRDQSRYTFESFVIGPSNRFAHAAALAVAETPGRAYNPVFIYGDAGLGKTHLLRAIGNYINVQYPSYTVRYISTETMMNEFIDSLWTKRTSEFKRRYRDIQVLLIDDIQFLEAKKELQEEFFHTFNSLYDANCQIVLSSDRAPDAVKTLEDRLRSRFKQGLVTDIQPPDFETRMAILRAKVNRSDIELPSAVLDFIVTNVTTNIREMEGALVRVTAWASLNNKRDVTIEDAMDILHDIVADRQPRRLTPAIILECVAEHYGFTVEEIKAKNRHRPLVLARQVGMYLFRDLTDLSYPQIAKEFGGRDHTTVIHAYEKITSLMKERQAVYDDVQKLSQQLRTG